MMKRWIAQIKSCWEKFMTKWENRLIKHYYVADNYQLSTIMLIFKLFFLVYFNILIIIIFYVVRSLGGYIYFDTLLVDIELFFIIIWLIFLHFYKRKMLSMFLKCEKDTVIKNFFYRIYILNILFIGFLNLLIVMTIIISYLFL